MNTCDEITDAAHSASTDVSCSMPINATNTASINFDDNKIRYKMDCCTFPTVLLVVVLLFIVTIIWCHYTKHRFKQSLRSTGALVILKIKRIKFEKSQY